MRRLMGAVIVAATLITAVGTSQSAIALPVGFTDVEIAQPAANPLAQPTALAALPNGGAIITEKEGTVRILNATGSIEVSDALKLAVCTEREMGLFGVAVDPNFLVNHFVYLFYTPKINCTSPDDRFNRVSRFRLDGTVINPATETELIPRISAYGAIHHGGSLEFGNDGYLYIATGDAGDNPRPPHQIGVNNPAAADLSLLNGKILRIDRNGNIPADNPLVTAPNSTQCASDGVAIAPTATCTEIFAWGLRNPFRIAFDPNAASTRFFINDVGQVTAEEVNNGQIGANYGWPSREGFCATGSAVDCQTPAGFTDPLHTYGREAGCRFITAGVFVPNDVWSSEFDNSYLFSDGACGAILRRDANGVVTPFTDAGATVVVDMEFVAAAGTTALYYLGYASNSLQRLSSTTAPAPPPTPLPAPAPPTGLAYTGLSSPKRVVDTRNEDRGLAAHETKLIDLGIRDTNVEAAFVNLTMIDQGIGGHLVAFAPETDMPKTSTLNALAGETVANAAIVPVDANGQIQVFSADSAQLVVDLIGVFVRTPVNVGGGRVHALSPRRLADTRAAVGASNSYLVADNGPVSDITVHLTAESDIPSNADGLVIVLTALSGPAATEGYSTVYAHGTAVPESSNVNVGGSFDVRANMAIVPIGDDDSITIRSVNVDDVVVDLAGYVAFESQPSGMYTVVTPTRVLDSRDTAAASLVAGQTTGVATQAFSSATAGAVVQNLTVTQSSDAGWITAFPSNETMPLASNLNVSAPNQTRAALAITMTPASNSQSLSYFNSAQTHLIVDITGYFTR